MILVLLLLVNTPSLNHHRLYSSRFHSAIFFTGDFNVHSQLWWTEGDTTPEGTRIEELFTKLGPSQLIPEPTNFEPHKNPSCIDLVVTDQPNIILDSRTRVSLDSYCHHQIGHCKVNFRIPPPLPFERKYGILIEQIQLLLKGA